MPGDQLPDPSSLNWSFELLKTLLKKVIQYLYLWKLWRYCLMQSDGDAYPDMYSIHHYDFSCKIREY